MMTETNQANTGDLGSSENVTVSLSNQEALVLFELLARSCDEGKLTIGDAAERRVLCDVLSQLESTLLDSFKPNYRQLLQHARDALRPPGA